MITLLDSLTDEQRTAVHSNWRWTSVQAGPGSGKTRVLAARIAWLVDQGADPRRICALVFTRSAAAEIRERLFGAIGHITGMVRVSTFHAFAAEYVVPDGFRVATETEADAALRSIYDGPTRRQRGLPGIAAVRRGIMAHESVCHPPHHERDAITIVRHRLEEARLIATWDLVPRFLEHGGCTFFDHVLVDEAQDCTANEGTMASGILENGEYLFTVGDPRQAIFGWRGARPDAFRDHNVHHTEMVLTRTFRFGPEIAQLANSISDRFDGGRIVGNSDIDSDCYMEPMDQALDANDPRNTAILCRTNMECDAIEREYTGIVQWVRRDPLDAFAHESDRFGDAWADGKAVVSTVHSFKGREADTIIIAMDPNSRSEDVEEERVLYVAVTRARHRLIISKALP